MGDRKRRGWEDGGRKRIKYGLRHARAEVII